MLFGNANCLWIGAPGEGRGGARRDRRVIRTHVGFGANAAAVRAFGTVIRLGGPGSDNIPCAPQAGSHVGSALATETPDHEGLGGRSGGETVIVAVPGHAGSATGSGEIWISHVMPSVRRGDADTVVDCSGVFTDSAGPRAREHDGTPATARTNGATGGE